MFRFSTLTHGAIGLAAVSALAFAPVAAQAAQPSQLLSGALTGGALTNTAPSLGAFSVGLTGVAQTIYTPVGSMNINDATGTNAGWSLMVTASAPQVSPFPGDVGVISAGTGGSITLSPQVIAATTGNMAHSAPVAASAVVPLQPSVGFPLYNAPIGTGQGSWDTLGDSGSTQSLAIVIPGDASAGQYTSTLTFTASPPVES